MPVWLNLVSFPTPLLGLLLVSFLPTASAVGAGATVDTVGFWLAFSLLVIVSAVESAFSITWTRIRITDDGVRPCELSCRVCGREICVNPIPETTASEIGTRGMPAGLFLSSISSVTTSRNGMVQRAYSSSRGCSCCGGLEFMRMRTHGGTKETVIDKVGSLMLVPSLLIRRFNPSASLRAPALLVNNVKSPGRATPQRSVGRVLEHTLHVLVSLTDVSLGVAGLVLNPGSPQKLYDTLKDPVASMTFENYSTLFLMYWILGALLLLCMIPQRSARLSVQIFGWPAKIAFAIAGLASVVLFALGCWKIDYARRHQTPWTPMLSYWIGGAGAISFPIGGIDVFSTFGVVGLVFMLKTTFN